MQQPRLVGWLKLLVLVVVFEAESATVPDLRDRSTSQTLFQSSSLLISHFILLCQFVCFFIHFASSLSSSSCSPFLAKTDKERSRAPTEETICLKTLPLTSNLNRGKYSQTYTFIKLICAQKKQKKQAAPLWQVYSHAGRQGKKAALLTLMI